MEKAPAQRSRAKADGNQKPHLNANRAVKGHNAFNDIPSRSSDRAHNGSFDHLLHLQRTLGNRAVGRFLQAKFTVSHPDDPYEREADRVADTVMSMPEPTPPAEEETPVQAKPLATQISRLVQRESQPPLEEEEEKVVATNPIVQRVPVAMREDDDEEEKVAPKLEPDAALQEEEKEKPIPAKLETDTTIRRQAKEDEEQEKEPLQTTPSVQRQMAEEDEYAVQTKPLSGVLLRVPGVSPVPVSSSGGAVQRLCTECEGEKQREEGKPAEMAQRKSARYQLHDDHDEEEQRVQAKGVDSATPSVTTSVAANIRSLNHAGSPLPQATRAFFEPRFGVDFSQVRVHTGTRAAETTNSINARAFTVGRDIAFSAGQYGPETQAGRRLVAHELTHVIQQDRDYSGSTIQRQDSTGGMTSGNAPTSVSVPPTVGPTTSTPTAADFEGRALIQKALDSKDVSDVKKIRNFALANQDEKIKLIKILLDQTWVGPFDEYALEDIWKSFGDGVVAVASTDEGYRLWQSCIDRGAELDNLPAVAKLRGKFEADIKAVVTGYLFQNRKLVMDEMQRLGIPAEESTPLSLPSPEQTNEIEKMQQAAAAVAMLQRAQEEARTIYVGYKSRTELNPSGPGAVVVTDPVRFDPYLPPESTSPPSIIAPGVRVEIKPYQAIKENYDKATKSIEGFLNLYPSLYAISREGKSTSTAAFAATTSPAQARQQLGVAMWKLFHDIEETQLKLDGGDLKPLDLTPIHDQLLGGLKPPSGMDWKLRLPESVAKDMVKDHQFAEALKSLGLQTAAAALFMLAPFTGGASIYVMLAGLAVTGVKLYLSTEQYETLAQAAKTSPKPGTELVTKGQVDEAKMAMEADQIAFALAVLVVGSQVAIKSFSVLKDVRTKLELRRGAAAVRSQYLGKPFPKGNVATAKIELEDGTKMGFGETSRQKSPLVKEPPLPQSKGGQFEPIQDPAKQGSPIANTDPEYKILSSAADVLEKQHGVNVKGKLYLYSERELCVSCNDVLGQFKAKFPNIEVKTFSDYPYPQQ